jgi:hypothetical protein
MHSPIGLKRSMVWFQDLFIFVRYGLWFYLPSEIHVCCCCCVLLSGTDEICNFSAVRSPIELKLGGDLGLVSQISLHVLLSIFDYFCPLQL